MKLLPYMQSEWPDDLLTWQLIFNWKEVTVLISGCHCGQSPAPLLTHYQESIVVSIFATETSKQLILWRVSWLAPFQSSSRASASYQKSLARRMWRCQCVKELHCKLCFSLPLRLCALHRTLCTKSVKARSSWLNCSLRGDEALYWVSIRKQWLEIGDTE